MGWEQANHFFSDKATYVYLPTADVFSILFVPQWESLFCRQCGNIPILQQVEITGLPDSLPGNTMRVEPVHRYRNQNQVRRALFHIRSDGRVFCSIPGTSGIWSRAATTWTTSQGSGFLL